MTIISVIKTVHSTDYISTLANKNAGEIKKYKEAITMAKNSKTAFEQMKYEVASEVGVNLKQGYNGDLSSRDAGRIGGNIVKKVFQSYTGNNYNQK